ncbi:MAG: PA14 domain-containing protein, partial [Verrucomicrobiota bacterium]
KEVGAAAAEYRASGGASGGATDGYLSITDAKGGQRATVVFDDLDKGLVVKAFNFECDLRIGGGTGRPADGFSLNYVRANDPLATDGSPYAGTGNETNLPEEGSLTGLGIGFDTWQSGDHPGGITDVVGISVRVEGALITQLPVPLRPGNVWPGGTFDEVPFRNLATTSANYAQSMQTGALNTTDDLNGDGAVDGNDANAPQVGFDDPNWGLWVKNLKWEKFKAQLTEDGKVKIFWKGVELTPAGGLASSFTPAPGRLVFGGRTGGAWEVHHVDNIRLETVPANDVIIGGAAGNPIGFSITTVDSGTAVAVTAGLSIKLNGTDISSKVATSKDGITTTIVYGDATSPLASGSTNTVAISVKDTLGRTVTANRSFVVGSYVTIPSALAVSGVDTSKKGFNIRTHQTARRDQPNTVARAEQQLAGLRGDNVADLGGFTGGVFAETGVINYSQPVSGSDATPGQNGAFSSSAGAVERQIADNAIPGIPSASEFQPNGDLYTDNIAAEITTYLQFPTAGVYTLTFNSDDGFRTTVGGNNKEVLSSLIVSEADYGKGASDINATVFVPAAGYYPFRTVWFEGGGGANLEWSAQRVAPSPTARYLINDAAADAVKAFRATSAATPAAVSFIHPFRASGGNYVPTVPVVVSVVDGSTAVSSFKLLVDGAEVSPTKASAGGVTTYTYKPAANFAPGSHTAIVRFTAGAQQYDATNTFNILNAAKVPGSLALPSSAVNTGNKGFLVKTVQQENGESMGNDTYRGQTHIAGLIGTKNVADLTLFTGPQGYYVETGVINYNQDAVSSGYFPDDPGVPGIPGTTGSTDNYAQEILTVLDLKAGFYCFNVNSDDGFRLDIGNPGEAFTFPLVVGEFSGGRGNGGGIGSGTSFFFSVEKDGLYPARLVWYEGGGGSNVEFSTRQFDPVTGDVLSGNLVNADGGIKAYQYPLASKGVPFVKTYAPARTGRASGVAPYRAGTDSAITAQVAQGTGPALTTANVSVTVDGVAATPTITTADGVATVSVAAPAAGWANGSTHKVELTIIDRTVSWTFGVGNIRTPVFAIEAEDFDNNGVAPASTSVMPYRGGALAGQPATNNKDYTRGNEGSSPLYRIGEDPQVPMDRTGDRDRGLGELNVNYKMGWIGDGQWYQYTRTFPAGDYNVYAALSHGDGPDSATRVKGQFATVASGSATVVGSFEAPSTGGWGNNALVPMRNADGSLASVKLSGQQTVRFNASNGDYDFLLFTPALPANVLSKADTIVPTSKNSPGAEGVEKVIDGDSKTKYLNFDKLNTGFTVTPKAGASVISGISITTANDAPERDPATWQILGSNDGTTFEAIATGSVPVNSIRFRTETIAFSNTKSYTSYKVLFPTVVDAAKANSMQVAEVALHGTAAGGGDAPRFTGIKANADGTITITWTGGGVLQSATSLSGPWTDVAGAASPLTVPANQAAQFARIRK